MLPRLRVNLTRSPLAEASKISPPSLPLKSIVSVPAWPSTVSLPSPGSHWKVSSPAPRKATSLPCWPSMKSLPSPPSSRSTRYAKQRVVASAAIDGDLDQRREVAGGGEEVVAAVGVEDEVLRSANVEAERRGVDAIEAHPSAVGGDGEVLVTAATVDLDGVDAAPPSLRSVSSPGFQIIRSLPASPKTWSSASPPVRVSFSEPPKRKSMPPLPTRVSLPAWPKSMSPPAPPVSVSLPAPPNRFARGRAPLAWSSVIVSLPPWPKLWIREVLATVGVPPDDGHRAAVDEDVPGGVAADRDGVIQVVAEDSQDTALGRKRPR